MAAGWHNRELRVIGVIGPDVRQRSHFRLFLILEYGVLGSGRREVQQFVRRQLRVLFDNS